MRASKERHLVKLQGCVLPILLETCPGLPVPVATMMMTALGSSGSSSTFPVGPAHVQSSIDLLFMSRLAWMLTSASDGACGVFESTCSIAKRRHPHHH